MANHGTVVVVTSKRFLAGIMRHLKDCGFSRSQQNLAQSSKYISERLMTLNSHQRWIAEEIDHRRKSCMHVASLWRTMHPFVFAVALIVLAVALSVFAVGPTRPSGYVRLP
ncbi:hypothetical protein [Alicyclobacillus ferrooxydans]|nr:hypothetical protein [Alicyclobacillus ferrooxydans]